MDLFVEVLNLLFTILWVVVLADILVSWIIQDPFHPIRRFLDSIVQPMLEPIRRIIPPVSGIDFSPLILLIVLDIARRLLVGLLAGAA